LANAQNEADKKYWQDIINTTEEALDEAKQSALD